MQDKSFDIAQRYKVARIYPEKLGDEASHSVMLFRPSMCRDVEEAGCLKAGCLVYSMWEGYLADDSMAPFLGWLDEMGLPLHRCHTSGHASVRDLRKLCNALPEATVVPVHTERPDICEELFDGVERRSDGEWWEVG